MDMNEANRQQAETKLSSSGKEQNTFVISSRQSASIISSTIIGVGVLTLPRTTVEIAGQSGWMVTILGAFLAMLAIYIITKLGLRFPGKNIAVYAAEVLGTSKAPFIGRMLSFPICLAFIVFWGLYTVVVARMFGEVVITTVLPRTPLEVIISTMLITGMILVMYDVEVLARVNEILLPIIIMPVLIIALSSFQSAKLENIMPLFTGDWMSLLKGILLIPFSYLGFEVMVLFLAYTQPSDKVMGANLIGIAIPGFVYTLIVIAGTSVFGVEELTLLTWPTLELVKVTQVPGLILERLESAFLGVWVAAVFTTAGNLYFATTLMIMQLFGFKKKKWKRWIALFLLPVFYWLSLQPQNIHALFKYQTGLGYFGGVVAFILPLFLLLIALLRKKGSNKKRK